MDLRGKIGESTEEILCAKDYLSQEKAVSRLNECLLEASRFNAPKYETLFAGFSSDYPLSPRQAADCLMDIPRTVAFIRALDQVIQTFNGEVVHVLELGCGPLAPLALTAAIRHPNVYVSMNDFHQDSIECVGGSVRALSLAEQVKEVRQADATYTKFDSSINVVAYDVLQAALLTEPHGRVTHNLARQFGDRVIYVPNQVNVDAWLEIKGERQLLGRLAEVGPDFRAMASSQQAASLLRVNGNFRLDPSAELSRLILSTEVHLSQGELLHRNESILTRDVKRSWRPPLLGCGSLTIQYTMGDRDFRFSPAV